MLRPAPTFWLLLAGSRATVLVLLSALLWAIPQAATAAPLTSVKMQLRWLHQFQFAGYYAALHKGFYRDVGLDVTLAEGGPNVSAIEEVLQGRADFGVSTSGLVKSYLEGRPVLMLAPIFQHSPQVLLSLDTRIKTISDLAKAGSLSLQPGDESLELKALFVHEGFAMDKLSLNTDGLGLKDLMSGRISAMNAYLSNEPFLLKKLNWPYVVFSPQQFGMDFYSDVLFTSRAVEKANPGAVAAFRTATLKGWEYALAHREEIISLILTQYNTQDKSREFLTFEANTLADLIDADVIQLGHSNPGRWRRIVETYGKFGIIKFDYNLDGFFYNPNPPPPDLTWLYQLAAAVLSALGLIALVVLYVHRLNRKLHRANEVCEQTLDEKHQFMDMLTHELKTPISVVTLTLGQMTDESTGQLVKNRAGRALDAITSIVERCQQLDQLEHRKPALKLQDCDLAEIVNQLKIKSPDAQRLVCAQESLPVIPCDLQLLNIILGNLVINAYMYSAPRSTIGISVLPLEDAGVQGIQISIENMPGSAGTPDPSKVFTKYYRSAGAKAQTGSGLGLYLAHSFTTLLGGKISFATDSGHIRFTLWLPT